MYHFIVADIPHCWTELLSNASISEGGQKTVLGTERLLAKQPDILIPFFKCITAYVPKDSKPEKFLFPRSLVAAGWNHLVDGLVRRGLCSLPWFPSVLDSIKAINRSLT